MSGTEFQQMIRQNERNYGLRQFYNEVSGKFVECFEGKSRYACVGSFGSYNDFVGIIDSAGGRVTPLAAQEAGNQYSHLVKDYTLVTHFRNINLHPIFVSFYDCVAKHSIALDTSAAPLTADALILADLRDGWKADAGTGGLTGTTAATGDAGFDVIVDDANGTSFDSYYKHLKIASSRGFTAKWKINASQTVKLNPGDDFYYSTKMPNTIFSAAEWTEGFAGSTVPLQIKGGKTHCHMIKLTGCMGESAGTAHNYNTMRAALPYETIIRAQVVQINRSGGNFNVQVLTDARLADYQGPTDEVDQADES